MPEPQPSGGGFLAKSGLDSIKIGGKKIPIALIGGVAAVAGVILFIRARQSGSNVAQVGTVPAANTGVNPAVYSGGGLVADPTAALANLNQQLTGIQQSLTQAPQPVAPPAPLMTLTLRQRFQTQFPGSLGYDYGPAGPAGVLPLYNVQGGIAQSAGNVAYGSSLTETGVPVQASFGGVTGGTFYPVGGGQFVSQSDIIGPPH